MESEIAVQHLGLDRFAIDIRGHRPALHVTLPPGLPAQRGASAQRAMQHCTVHESVRRPPRIEFSIAPDTEAVVSLAAAVPTHA